MLLSDKYMHTMFSTKTYVMMIGTTISLVAGLVVPSVAFADAPTRTINYDGSGSITCPDGSTGSVGPFSLSSSKTKGDVTGFWKMSGGTPTGPVSKFGDVNHGVITPKGVAKLSGDESSGSQCGATMITAPVQVHILIRCDTGVATFSADNGETATFSGSCH